MHLFRVQYIRELNNASNALRIFINLLKKTSRRKSTISSMELTPFKIKNGSKFFIGCTLIKMPVQRILNLLISRGFSRYELNIEIIKAEQRKVLSRVRRYTPAFDPPLANPRTNSSALCTNYLSPPENVSPAAGQQLVMQDIHNNDAIDKNETDELDTYNGRTLV